MIGGGLPITTAILTIADEMPNRSFELICKDIAGRLERGESLTEAVEVHEKVFGRLGCAMIMAGESSGSLTASLQRLAEYYDTRDKLTRKVRGALAYPLFVMAFIIVIVAVMMTLIIPRFSSMFDELGDKLPAFTRGFMAVYSVLMQNMPVILIVAVVGAVGTMVYSKTKTGHMNLCRLMLRIPMFGNIVRMAFVATFCKTLGTLIASGVSVIDAFSILAGMTSNDVLNRGVLDTRDRLMKGVNISQSMESAGFFPGVAVKMVRIGEESGSLSSVLEKTSEYYGRKVELLISSLLGMLEPTLIVIVGAIVLVVLLAMYLPIFSMSA
jgi:type IV pilus assembly protein PilC